MEIVDQQCVGDLSVTAKCFTETRKKSGCAE